ncbi:D-inositol 3-phosphate glycosyltransferase [Maioricimonas rarisocia]|uniref:D-inositol 3-phosphate glycosyltransferase n=2 Tax=Maioricimonas rarisocia TaxID=2528026 RepID=A0A517ZA55_9PLAN|nr:D-inositol 3-phosphate glycosyltransferase [Maioricimonas rarisocia]
MFCGSCMHDNTWARALMAAGCQVSLIPTYTPIRVDEANVSSPRVFLGGLNVYLDYRYRFWQRIPRKIARVLDQPWLINLATKISVSNDAAELGDLTLAMLEGESGPHHREVAELAEYVCALEPDVVIFSNALLAGALREVRKVCRGPIYCTLQGDDVFLDSLPEDYRQQAIEAVAGRAVEFDGFMTHSRFYRDYIARYLQLDSTKFGLLPLGIDLDGHDGVAGERNGQPFTVGYFARIAPEKGLRHLAEAFCVLHQRRPEARLRVGGYLAPQNRSYLREVQKLLRPVGDAFEYVGSPATHEEKVRFLRSIDVLSVPTEFQEPKGLYVLEALANGRPVVQPRHGAFPELIEATGGGRLVEPRDPVALADALEELADQPETCETLGTTGQTNVRAKFSPPAMAQATIELLERAVKA